MAKKQQTPLYPVKWLYDHIMGEKSKTMYISSDGERVMSFPWMLAVLFLTVFDVPSWVIGCLLLCLIIFDRDLNVETNTPVSGEEGLLLAEVVDTEGYRQSHPSEDQPVDEGDGFYSITIK